MNTEQGQMNGMNSGVVIKEVSTKKERKQFCEFPLGLYKDCSYYIPLVFSDEMKIFDPKKNMYSPVSKSRFFLCYKNGVLAGRISAIIVFPYLEKSGRKVMRFTRVDFIDDMEVSKALFDAVKSAAVEEGLNEIQGPMGYSDMEREGLLVEGFDRPATYISSYSYDYYAKHFEAYGLIKEIDWLEYLLKLPEKPDEKITRLAGLVAKRYKLKEISGTLSINKLVKNYGHKLFDALNAAYEPLHGTIPITGGVAEKIINMLKIFLIPDFFSVIVDENDDVVAFGVIMPSITDELVRCRGKLNPLAILRLLHAKNHPKGVELGLIAVRPEYQKKGVSAMIIDRILRGILSRGITECETNLELETNTDVISLWNNIDKEQIKRHRCYMMKI